MSHTTTSDTENQEALKPSSSSQDPVIPSHKDDNLDTTISVYSAKPSSEDSIKTHDSTTSDEEESLILGEQSSSTKSKSRDWYSVSETDISLIPYEYQLSHRHYYTVNSRYDYIITSLSGTPMLYINSTSKEIEEIVSTNSTFELALEVSKSWKLFTPAYYEVQEDRYLSDGSSYKVVTVSASYTSWIYFAWGPPITIKFKVTDQLNPLDPLNLTQCEYQFTWTWIMNGYVNRKCPNEDDLTEISYVSGSSLFGFYFWNPDETIIYGYSTIPNLDPLGLYESAPFPPIIPALYTAYYEYLINLNS
ncbi:11469_t:CDS:2 [Diversispora eburnea]|uniref:11469_t:CDS:1 n=1 Tax=Diversispora eburnea TaxID=1213867 RepID=A0A9N9BFY6_9GLOM|nr:11469_t:CDS:2 [Diversispora eburnea]